ncbi:MAG: NUDIX domain-containing protein [Halobacteriales archaeon]|nr:NUDIX domain-containing protein [Halobacteriales archaeon]
MSKNWRDVRPQVLGIVRRGNELLVEYYEGPSEQFYRPLGGGLEFGESSDEAVVREFAEEIGARVEPGAVLGTIENQFRWDGESFHELTVVREVRFRDDGLYEREQFTATEPDGSRRQATWEPLDSFDETKQLLPAGIKGLIDGEQTHLVSPATDTELHSA